VAGWALGINPFDQPNVQEAKDNTAWILKEGLPDEDLGSLEDLLAKAEPPKYIAILGFVTPSDEYDEAVTELRTKLRERTRCTTTFGYGPRYLHSTGQYHKGGPADGVFVQILGSGDVDLEIPGRPFTFGQLIAAQAAGDAAVLVAHGRPVVTLTLTDPQTDVLALFEAAQ
jgi:glucose-6-phosphate isomerase